MGADTYSYSYDDIGNRKWSAAGAASSTYTANQLNQCSSVTNAGDRLSGLETGSVFVLNFKSWWSRAIRQRSATMETGTYDLRDHK